MQLSTRHQTNPFLQDLVVMTTNKAVRVSHLGQDKNVLINQATGEVHGTHVVTHRQVDSEQFVKLFVANISMTFGLKSAGIKAFSVLIWAVQNMIEKDTVVLDGVQMAAFLNKHDLKLSQATFARGLNELERAQLIAKTIRKGWYFINPSFVFNGNRVAFTTLIERVEEPEQLEIETE